MSGECDPEAGTDYTETPMCHRPRMARCRHGPQGAGSRKHQALPGTQGAAPLPDTRCSDSPCASIPSKAEPPRMASSSLHLLGRVPARARVGLRLQPATVPQHRPWPELSSPLPGGKHQPRPAEVNAGTFREFLEHDARRDTGQPSPGVRAGVPRAGVSVGRGRQHSGQALQTRSGPGGRCAEKLRGLS